MNDTEYGDVENLVREWNDAFSASDIDRIASLYADDATFIGTSSKGAIQGRSGIRDYFAVALLDKRRFASIDSIHVDIRGEFRFVTGISTTKMFSDGEWLFNIGRLSLVAEQRDGGLSIVHFHRSEVP